MFLIRSRPLQKVRKKVAHESAWHRFFIDQGLHLGAYFVVPALVSIPGVLLIWTYDRALSLTDALNLAWEFGKLVGVTILLLITLAQLFVIKRSGPRKK